MKLRFTTARHGWLPTTLALDGGETLAFDVSHVAYDFVSELVAALSGVLDAPGEYAAWMCEEPVEHEWRFRSADPSAILFEVVMYRHGRGRGGDVVARVSGPPLQIVLPLWRGLRELAGRARAEDWQSHWNAPFPFEALDQLTERLDRART